MCHLGYYQQNLKTTADQKLLTKERITSNEETQGQAVCCSYALSSRDCHTGCRTQDCCPDEAGGMNCSVIWCSSLHFSSITSYIVGTTLKLGILRHSKRVAGFVEDSLTVVCQALKNHSEIYKDIKHVGQGIQITTATSFYLFPEWNRQNIRYQVWAEVWCAIWHSCCSFPLFYSWFLSRVISFTWASLSPLSPFQFSCFIIRTSAN